MSLAERYLFTMISVLILTLSAPVALAQSLTKSYVPGEVIVKYKTDSSESNGKKVLSTKARSRIAAKSQALMMRKNLSVKNSWSGLGTYHYKIKSSEK